MFRPTRASSGALKFGGTAVPSTLLRSLFFVFIMFLNEVNVVPSSKQHVLSFLVCLLLIECSV
jgi:hypothetical protein